MKDGVVFSLMEEHGNLEEEHASAGKRAKKAVAAAVDHEDVDPKKEQDRLNNQLSMTLMQLLTTFASVLGTVGLVICPFPLLVVIFALIAIRWRFTPGGRLWRRSDSTRSCDLLCMLRILKH
ncbi:hypothetical protein C8R45DRAFT_1022669 [Mycena sanguinolenta]|nr:hypothetical protein C8R45DRAFT_1022669 [Mycena sanguinolenta]